MCVQERLTDDCYGALIDFMKPRRIVNDSGLHVWVKRSGDAVCVIVHSCRGSLISVMSPDEFRSIRPELLAVDHGLFGRLLAESSKWAIWSLWPLVSYVLLAVKVA